MKQRRIGTRALALLLTLAMCLSLLPMTALAGYSGPEAFYYDLTRPDEYNAASYLEKDSAGNINFSLSGGLAQGYVIRSVYLVTEETHQRVGTIMENGQIPAGATGGYDESPDGPIYNGVWIENVTLSGIEAGLYQTEFVTDTESFFSTDVSNEWYTAVGTIEVVENGSAGLSITTTALAGGCVVGAAYTDTLKGTSVTAWSAEGLPDGLTLDQTTGVISGTPTTAGSYSVMVTASDGTSTVSRTFSLTVQEPQSCTVSYYSNGGTGKFPTQTVLTGTKITLPAAPARNGYFFGGWSDGTAIYAANAEYTVTKTVYFRAQWTEMPGVTVQVPADLGQVVGRVCLMGTGSGFERTLWSKTYREATTLTDLTVGAAALGGDTYSKLSLMACVDDVMTEIAGYTGTVQAGEAQTSVTLTKSGVSFTVLEGVEVAGLTEGADFTVRIIKNDANRYIYSSAFPVLVTTGRKYTVSLDGVQGSPAYTEYDWSIAQSSLTVENNRLAVTPAPLVDTVTVSGKVSWDQTGGPAAAYVTVQATQEVGGVYRTVTANTNRSGGYSLKLYPGAPAAFTVLSSGGTMYITGDKILESPAADSLQNLTVKWVALSTGITFQSAAATDAEKAVVERYLRAMDWHGRVQMNVTGGGQTDTFSFTPNSLDTFRNSVSLYGSAASESVNCTLTGSVIAAAGSGSNATAKGVALSGGTGEVEFTPMLNPGVVVNLRAPYTMSVVLVFFDETGALKGESSVSISEYSRDYAAPCPVGTKTVVLLPGSYAKTFPKDLTLTGLTAGEANNQVLAQWSVGDAPLAAGQIADLTDFTIQKAAAENALFVTKPGSTLFASADSFLTGSDVIAFTGSIGLDSGLKNGKLHTLTLNTLDTDQYYRNSVLPQTLVIDGRTYTAFREDHGRYYLTFSTPIDLPCDYTVYCNPGGVDVDMQLSVTGTVSYDGGSTQYDQLIGSAVVSRPGASLDTLSTYVCEDRITVSGTARKGETVTIYDNGAVIGTAAGDETWGEWTALVPLYGTDDTLTTSHQLYAVTASGVVSNELTVIHNKTAPQLRQFTMSWRTYSGGAVNTINVGGAYIYVGGMYDTTFTAKFDNPGKLDAKTGWGSTKVIFKVYTADGEIRFLEAEDQGGGVFTATVDTTLRSSVTAAEVMYEPDVPGGMTVDANGVAVGQAPAEYAAAVKDTAETVQSDLTAENAYPTSAYVVEYNTDGTPKTLHYFSYDVDENNKKNNIATGAEEEFETTPEQTISIVDNPTDDMAKMVKDYYDAGLRINSVRTTDDSQISLRTWLFDVIADVSALNHIAYDERTGDEPGSSRSRVYSMSRLYKGGTYKGEEITAKQAFDFEQAFMESAKAKFPDMTHTRLALENDGDSYDVYQITIMSEDGIGLEDCSLTVTFLACDGVYSMSAAALFSPQYCSKAIADKWTDIVADVERQEQEVNAGLLQVTADAGGRVTVSNRLLASAPTVRVMGSPDMDEMLPAEDDRNSYQFVTPEGEFDESLHREYMRSLRVSVGLPAEEAEDDWEILRRQRMYNYDKGDDGKWADPKYYAYDGDFKPRSAIAQSCMEDVNAYYNRQRSDAATTGMSDAESWSGHGNLGAAITSGIDPTKVSTYAGDATAVANVAINAINSHEAKNDLREMMGDLDQLKNSPCYKKLKPSQRELVDKAYDEFKYWYDSAMNQISATQLLGLACNAGGCANSRVEYAGKLAKLRNWGVGVILSASGEMNSAVGGQMIKTSFTNAIVTYNEGYKQMKGVLRSRSVQLEDPDCKGKPSGGGGGGGGNQNDDGEKQENQTGNDPSGVVYEAVIQNPVEGAAVTLYYGANGSGAMVKEADSSTVTQLKPAGDVRTLIPNEAVQVTGPDGLFQWGVPAGLWYVTAEYAGLEGNSNADKAAKVSVSGLTLDEKAVTNLLPVLPIQLDVNIPLVDATAPSVEDVLFTDEGIFVTFSKYMVDTDDGSADSVLTPGSFTLSGEAGPVTFTVESAEQGNAPANVDPDKTTYSRTVLLKPSSGAAFAGELTLTVAGTVKSYAGTAMGMDYNETAKVSEMVQLGAPSFEPGSGTMVQRGDTVTISLPADAPEGAKICYTTDGSDPADGKVYDGPVAVTDDMTIQAVAVCTGWQSSDAASASFTVAKAKTAEEIQGSISVTPTDSGLSVRVLPPFGETFAAGFCAAYDEDGKMLAVRPLSAGGGEQTLTLVCDAAKACSVKAFLLNSNYGPVVSALTWTKSE